MASGLAEAFTPEPNISAYCSARSRSTTVSPGMFFLYLGGIESGCFGGKCYCVGEKAGACVSVMFGTRKGSRRKAAHRRDLSYTRTKIQGLRVSEFKGSKVRA